MSLAPSLHVVPELDARKKVPTEGGCHSHTLTHEGGCHSHTLIQQAAMMLEGWWAARQQQHVQGRGGEHASK